MKDIFAFIESNVLPSESVILVVEFKLKVKIKIIVDKKVQASFRNIALSGSITR